MWFLEIYRMFCGYVHFTASKGFCERFINLCGKNSINLWKIETAENTVRACTTAKDYLKIKHCATRSGMITKINSKHGLPFFINRYRKRIGLFYGMVFAICFITVMSTMIWGVEITSNNRVTDEQIIQALTQAGVKYGTFRKNVDAASTRFFMFDKLPDLSYITINVIGSTLQVKVAEHDPEPYKIDSSMPCDVVSTVDGQIVALDVYHGTKLYKTGEAVRKGDVLAGGFIELSDGSVKFKHAEAYALIRTNLDFESVTNRTAETLTLTDEKRKITLHIMGLNIPLFKTANSDVRITRNRSLIINNIIMPFGITTEICRTYTAEKTVLNDEKFKLTASENYHKQKICTLAGAYICSQQNENEATDDTIVISTHVLGEVSAGIAQEMMIN